METKKTLRGFAYSDFLDRYDHSCSIQKSSLATEDCIWFGIDDPEPKILASQAEDFGIQTLETTGWIPYPVPTAVSLNTRMHLSQDQVKELLPILQHFVDTGELPEEEKQK